ncbi:MAG: hypothetical protein DCC52_15105, partial [Chloroflexi bacterium]
GYIEGKEYKIASEISGRVNAVNAEEGARVRAGDVLIELDHTLLDAQIAQAQAAVKTAAAQLLLVQNSARPSDLAAAQAALHAAQENYAKISAGANASDLAAAQAASQCRRFGGSPSRVECGAGKLRQSKTRSDARRAHALQNASGQCSSRAQSSPSGV